MNLLRETGAKPLLACSCATAHGSIPVLPARRISITISSSPDVIFFHPAITLPQGIYEIYWVWKKHINGPWPYSGVLDDGSLAITLFTSWTLALYQPVQQHLWIIAVLGVQKQQDIFCNENVAGDRIRTALMHTYFIQYLSIHPWNCPKFVKYQEKSLSFSCPTLRITK